MPPRVKNLLVAGRCVAGDKVGLDPCQVGLDHCQVGLDHCQVGLNHCQVELDHCQVGLDREREQFTNETIKRNNIKLDIYLCLHSVFKSNFLL